MKYLLSTAMFRKGANDEKRSQRRRTVGIRARLRERGAKALAVDVIDLSTAGFRAETSVELYPGEIVWLTLPGLGALEAVVAWRDRYRYGCAFRTGMHPAVLDHIVAANWA